MMRRFLPLLALLLVLALVAAACGGDTSSDTEAAVGQQSESGNGSESATSTEADPPLETTEAGPPPTVVDPPDETVPGGPITFGFVDGSEVRFIIEEELRGSLMTVVGVNKALDGTFVTGETGSELLEPATVVIGASAFVTDEDRRDGAIDRFILDVSDHPEITFTFDTIDGEGTVDGVLTIRGVSHPVTFLTTGTAKPTRIEIHGSATVNRTDWGINIPSVPFVANVSEDVTLEFDFILEPIA